MLINKIDIERLDKLHSLLDAANVRFKIAEIVKRTGIDKGNASAYLNGKKPMSDNFYKTVIKEFGGNSEIEIDSTINKEIGSIHERLITLEAMARITNMNVFELRAKVFGTSYSSETLNYEGNVAKEIDKIFFELRRKGVKA